MRGAAQYFLVAQQNELLPGPRQGHIQLAVDPAGFVGRHHQLELVLVVAAEADDDDVALRALVALHGVDADLEQGGQIVDLRQLGQARADAGGLVAVTGDDAQPTWRSAMRTASVKKARGFPTWLIRSTRSACWFTKIDW